MIEVHLIGYTADLESVVFDLDEDGGGRYCVTVDGDLFATLDEIREQRVAAGLDVGGHLGDAPPEPADAGAGEDEPPRAPPPQEGADRASAERAGWIPIEAPAEPLGGDVDGDGADSAVRLVDAPEVDAPEADAPAADDADVDAPATEAPDADAAAADDADVDAPDADAPDADDPEPAALAPSDLGEEPEPVPEATEDAADPVGDRPAPTLSPAEIQNLLRRGRSVGSVAKAAGTDPSWIERWLPPIVAERERILARAWGQVLRRPRLGPSADPLRAAVDRNLQDRDVDPARATWRAARRADDAWTVSVRFTQRGRSRSATWVLPEEGPGIDAASDLARELGFTRDAGRGREKAATRPVGDAGDTPVTAGEADAVPLDGAQAPGEPAAQVRGSRGTGRAGVPARPRARS